MSAFTIAVGDWIECFPEGSSSGKLHRYRVTSVSANGALFAQNVATGKVRQFPGYGRIIPVGSPENLDQPV